MSTTTWVNAPLGLGVERKTTRTGYKTVLVMIPHLVAGTRLMDLVPLIETDPRIQVMYTVPDADSSSFGVLDFVKQQGGLVLPWQQAIHSEFDLVLAASGLATERVRGKVLTLPHGAGALKSRSRPPKAGTIGAPMHGLTRELLMRDGSVVASAIMLTQQAELAELRRSCPEAVEVATVAGDVCLDRMLASVPYRYTYRHCLGIQDHQKLVVVSSTWHTESLFGRDLDLYRSLVDTLPSDEYRIAAVIHPNTWAFHGRRQIRAWLTCCVSQGMIIIPPEEGWRAAMIAADCVIGDHGSTTQYAAALGRPVVLGTFPDGSIRPGSPADVVSMQVPRLDPATGLESQIREAIQRGSPDNGAEIRTELTSKPGQSASIYRSTIYQLLDLSEPPEPALATPVPAYFDTSGSSPCHRCGGWESLASRWATRSSYGLPDSRYSSSA